ncbi:MAG TPA: IS110 family transposase [Blastocatellia bacterium]|nr:IS110 family transposase [Blastocatellia bacterium]
MHLATLGIDIAKATFHAALLHNRKLHHHRFDNTPSGFVQLQAGLVKHRCKCLHACLEATGPYGDELADFLYQAGHTVSVVNPARIKGFAQSELQRNKTDQLDAALIARFCAAKQPEAWAPPPLEIKQLQGLVRRLEAVSEMRQQEVHRLAQVGKQPLVGESLNKIIAALDQEIGRLRQLIKAPIDNHPGLKRDRDLLVSIPGIGETTAAWLLSEVQVQAYRSARQVAAHTGLTPRHHQSGTSVHGPTHLSKIGNRRLRRALYMPALSAKPYNPIIQAFCQRLAKRGKRPMEIVGAAMRKLLHIVYGVLKSGKAFDPSLAS